MFTARYELSLAVAHETAVCHNTHNSGQLGYGHTLSQNVVSTNIVHLIFSLKLNMLLKCWLLRIGHFFPLVSVKLCIGVGCNKLLFHEQHEI